MSNKQRLEAAALCVVLFSGFVTMVEAGISVNSPLLWFSVLALVAKYFEEMYKKRVEEEALMTPPPAIVVSGVPTLDTSVEDYDHGL